MSAPFLVVDTKEATACLELLIVVVGGDAIDCNRIVVVVPKTQVIQVAANAGAAGWHWMMMNNGNNDQSIDDPNLASDADIGAGDAAWR